MEGSLFFDLCWMVVTNDIYEFSVSRRSAVSGNNSIMRVVFGSSSL